MDEHVPRSVNRMVVLSEVQSIRRLILLTSTILICLILVNLAAHAYRIWLIETQLTPLTKELSLLYKEIEYECKRVNTRVGQKVQCSVRPTSQQQVDDFVRDSTGTAG